MRPRRSLTRWLMTASLGAFGFVGFVPAHAGATETETCLAAVEQGEQLKKRGQLVSARQELSLCARDECPAPVRAMCRKYLDEVDSAMPTLEISARDAAANGKGELRDVKISVDGEARSPGPDGTIAVDPGARLVRIERAGAVEETLVKVAVGQKRTPVVVIFGAARRHDALPPPAAAPPARESRAKPLPYILGGVGVLALGGAGAFGVKWIADSECRPRCAPDEVDRIRTDAIFADVFAGVGLVSLGIATVLLLTSAPDGGAKRAAAIMDASRTGR